MAFLLLHNYTDFILQMVVRKRHADVVKILIRIKEAILYG
ncbi:hypothetical protein W728_02140 [Staphylococcus aureus VET1884R]|nr:hypothetical protein V096_01836 [Staphylococcus aureus GD2010-169]EZY25020.1 hypothetical protein V097_00651 [Staphylococcus aureus GD2010-168]KAI03049.1 hypothetical protein W728_02140 [Staphylococcus aureus VET1884R]